VKGSIGGRDAPAVPTSEFPVQKLRPQWSMRPLIGKTHFRTTQKGNPAPYRKITHGCCRWAYMQLARSGMEIGHVANLGVGAAAAYATERERIIDALIEGAIHFLKWLGDEVTVDGIVQLATAPPEFWETICAMCERRIAELKASGELVDLVTVRVDPLTRAYGKGRLKFTTVVMLDVLQGVAVMSDRHGHLRVELPQTRHPSTGVSYPCISVPIELHPAIEVALQPSARPEPSSGEELCAPRNFGGPPWCNPPLRALSAAISG
jgi:hypothetical protein